eukprot:scpid89435/ scgid24871/ 
MIRKVLEESDDWRASLQILMYYYRALPHSATKKSPMKAMVGREPRDLIVEGQHGMSASRTAEKIEAEAAAIRDYLEQEMSAVDCTPDEMPEARYAAGDKVMLKRPDRSQKRQSPYERGWMVAKVVSPTTFVIRRESDGAEKMVNVALLKGEVGLDDGEENVEERGGVDAVASPPCDKPARLLRDRARIHGPVRYGW